ncbi:hypothetical protein [Tunicatimonas pelagia]|uniref:hypothetical protein n=1 Tax=Tunicatimonas pelagia TaxID=931531 RepID=UPI0026651EB0|nr:hypothetical protein [Tunicatimonas pelagia]WKN42197.1 hypothetical protein P0M28_24475 [Tunicatimonas pelagia]
MKPRIKVIAYVIGVILFFWTGMTFWVQYTGEQQIVAVGDESSPKKALIIYNPDPIYNLDEQVCRSFAEGLSHHGFSAKIATIELAHKKEAYDLYVFFANTYNWAPDWLIQQFIRDHPALEGKMVVAITMGAGETTRSQRKLESAILATDALLIGSRTYWLLHPNNESRMDEKNTDVAKDLARAWGESIGEKLLS